MQSNHDKNRRDLAATTAQAIEALRSDAMERREKNAAKLRAIADAPGATHYQEQQARDAENDLARLKAMRSRSTDRPTPRIVSTARPIDALDGKDSPITDLRISDNGQELVTREGLEFDSATLVRVDGVVHINLYSREHGNVHAVGVEKLERFT